MTKTLFTRPLYLQLADVLIARIASGEWKPGASIKNEIDLSKEFGVSVGTMRKALAVLEEARLLTRHQGKGSFVADASSQDHLNRYQNIYSIDGSPLNLRVRQSRIDFADDACQQLGIGLVDGGVFRCTQVHLTGNTASAFEEAFVPARLFPGLEHEEQYDLHSSAKRCGVMLGEGTEKVFFQRPRADVAVALGVRPHDRVAVMERLILGINSQPVEWRTVWTELKDGYYFARLA